MFCRQPLIYYFIHRAIIIKRIVGGDHKLRQTWLSSVEINGEKLRNDARQEGEA